MSIGDDIMKKLLTILVTCLLCLTAFGTNVFAVTNVSVKEITQDTDKVYVEFEGGEAENYVDMLTSYGIPEKAYIELTGDFLGYVHLGITEDKKVTGIYKESKTIISIKKSEMIEGNFPNETYTFNFYEVFQGQSTRICSSKAIKLNGLKDIDDLHYPEAENLEIKGVKIPVAGESISDSLKEAKVIAKYKDGSTKDDLLDKEYAHLIWTELDPDSAFIMYASNDTFIRLNTKADDRGFVHMEARPFRGDADTVTITINGTDYSFTDESLEHRGGMNGAAFGLKANTAFLNALSTASGSDTLVASDGINSISVSNYTFLYDRKDVEGDVFDENTTYALLLDYWYLKDDTSTGFTPEANTTVTFGDRTFEKEKGPMGFGNNVFCLCLGLAAYNSVFQTTVVGEPSISNVDDIKFNSNAVSELTAIISKMINDSFNENNDLSYLRTAIENGGTVSVDTTVTKLTTIPTEIENFGDDEVLGAVDIEVFVKVDDLTPVQLHELSDEVSFEYAIPGGAKANTTYYVLREHDGSVEKIEGSVVGDAVVFKTDKFSTYAIAAHKNPAPSNNGSNPRPGDKVVPDTSAK